MPLNRMVVLWVDRSMILKSGLSVAHATNLSFGEIETSSHTLSRTSPSKVIFAGTAPVNFCAVTGAAVTASRINGIAGSLIDWSSGKNGGRTR